MQSLHPQRITVGFGLLSFVLLAIASVVPPRPLQVAGHPPDSASAEFTATIQPLVKKYCLTCHSTALQKGNLDLERFVTVAEVRKDLKVWQGVIEQLEAREMPPKQKPQPTPEETQKLLAWVRAFLDREARTRVGDPGHVPLRRLSNAEFNYTVRDLTGVDLRPAQEFPADGAAGEGFTNAAEALSDVSPALYAKYLAAAKEIAEHMVLLPDGFRFSPGKTRRDWTDEGTARLQRFYAEVAPPDGKLSIQPYLAATVRHREALRAGTLSIAQVAGREKLNAKYLGILWHTLENGPSSLPLQTIRSQWRKATLQEVPALTLEITNWQTALWEVARVGNYGRIIGNNWHENYHRQVPHNPNAVEVQPVRLSVKPIPGQNDVVLRLSARDLLPPTPGTTVVWQRPRLEMAGKPTLLLKDYHQYSSRFEVDYPAQFANSGLYLTAVAEAAHAPSATVSALAQKHALDPNLLQRWIEVVALAPLATHTDPEKLGREIPRTQLDLLDEKLERVGNKPWLNGWRKKGQELPILIGNASDLTEQIPGKSAPRSITVHPTPNRFIAVAWNSPITGKVRVSARVTSVHPACGNGVAWWLELRHGPQTRVIAQGTVELGGAAKSPVRTLNVARGDQLLLAIDAKNGDHTCDLTEIDLTLTEIDPPARTWNLAKDIVNSIHAGNPHADQLGNPEVWRFVLGPSQAVTTTAQAVIPPGSLLDKWRDIAADPARLDEAAKIAHQVQVLLAGQRPDKVNAPDRLLYDRLVSADGILFSGMDLTRLAKGGSRAGKYGLPSERFAEDGNLVVPANSSIDLRLPVALMLGREFVVEGKLDQSNSTRAVQFQVVAVPTLPHGAWDGKGPLVADQAGAAYQQLLAGFADFRQVFPLFLCYPCVIANDEVVSLKMFHREDEALARLFLHSDQEKRLDRLWAEHEFVSQQAAAEHAYLPQFIEFVTQDGTQEALAFFKSLRPPFQRRAHELARIQAAAQPRHLDALLAFASKAFRRPLTDKAKADLLSFYQTLRRKGAAHEQACRDVLVRIFVAPAFLFRLEKAAPGTEPGPVDDWELASRLSYFLWSSLPDEELLTLAAAGRLRDPAVLVAQMRRMLQDARVRALAIEFGTQWIHVRGFDQFNEKNEKLFPTFTTDLRQAMYEESILFFQDLFQYDRSVSDLLNADATYLNETLAKHYGIPGVTGAHWRRVTGVKQHGRGGVLGLASVQTKQAGASRTSPILRGNWVVETLLGEKLPKPPPNVPMLPEVEGGTDQLTMRQLVERHTRVAECATCHQRIDPFGFALEKYDPIGRHRAHDLGGRPIDARARLKDGTEFNDLDGLRTYLLARKKDVITRLFCRRLLGYALGRSVTLSDTQVLDDMVAALQEHDGRVTAAVAVILHSPQFRMVRGREFVE